MRRIFNRARDHREAEKWDMLQHLQMSSEQRQAVAAELKQRVYGSDVPDVREYHKKSK